MFVLCEIASFLCTKTGAHHKFRTGTLHFDFYGARSKFSATIAHYFTYNKRELWRFTANTAVIYHNRRNS